MSETIEVNGLTFRVSIERDDDSTPPWERGDFHGPISDWVTRKKAPGERVLSRDRDRYRFYDFAGAMEIARKDGWGVKDTHGKTKGQITAEAVEQDFQYMKSWCDDEWWYVGVIVTLLDVDGHSTRVRDSVWGIESNCEDYLDETAKEMAEGLAGNLTDEEFIRIKIRSVTPDEHKATAEKLAAHYSAKLNGTVNCSWDEEKNAYCISGSGLPPHPDLRDKYPNGWSMLDWVSPKKAAEILTSQEVAHQ